MADQFHDSTPAVGNTVAADIPDIAESLGFIKDVFQEIGTGWSNTDATGFTLDKHHKTKNSPSAASSSGFTGLSANTMYHLVGHVNCSADTYLQLQFGNSGGYDTGNNYTYQYWSDPGVSGSATLTQSAAAPYVILGASDEYQMVDVWFITVQGDDTKAIVKSHTWGFDSSDGYPDGYTLDKYSGYYDGGSTIDRVQVKPASGTFTGYLWLIEFA